ncbi:MAG: hypothetical protein AAFO94_22165, partial [Bacteroidota bacterium]
MKQILPLLLLFVITLSGNVQARKFSRVNGTYTVVTQKTISPAPAQAAPALPGKWLNIEGKRIWEFDKEGQLKNYSLTNIKGSQHSIPFDRKGKKLKLQMDTGTAQEFKIISLDEIKMVLLDEAQEKTFRFIRFTQDIDAGTLQQQLSGQSFQASKVEVQGQVRLFSFRESGQLLQVVHRNLNPTNDQWQIKNLRGFNFVFINNSMHYLILPIDEQSFLLGDMRGAWQLQPYEKITLDFESIRKDLPGKWSFSINHPNGRRAVEIKLKKDGTGTWHSLNKEEKVPIRWHLKSDAPVLHIFQNANRNVDYLL